MHGKIFTFLPVPGHKIVALWTSVDCKFLDILVLVAAGMRAVAKTAY